jgi:hypothetical protein
MKGGRLRGMTSALFKRSMRPTILVIASCLILGCVSECRAQTIGGGSAGEISSAIADYFINWFPRVTKIQDEQPGWMTPLVTVTPRLQEQLRYDQLWQSQPNGIATDNFGGSRGLELIPWYNIEVILGIPPWIAHNGAIQHPTKTSQPTTDGWADETFLVKYRLLAANAEHGDYILTAFMGFSAPTGDDGNSEGHALFTPTLAFGKGLGNFDLQSTVGVTVPNGGLARLGMPVAYNTSFQYRVMQYFWPEFEVNYTWWPDGQRKGQSQVYLTSGVILGVIPIHDRIGVIIGAGYQVAVTKQPTSNHTVVLTGRIPF